MRTVAAVVTYNPDMERLRENLDAVSGQVDEVVVIDNGSFEAPRIAQLVTPYNLTFIRRSENGGIAVALNSAFRFALKHGFEWVLLLDQDSTCGPGMVDKMRTHISPGIAMVCPEVQDRRLPSTPRTQRRQSYEVAAAINSGSLCRVSSWEVAGGYDERLFIDYVDFDFCMRVTERGGQILRVSDAIMLHELGEGRRRGPFTVYNYSAFRSYHMARDMLTFSFKHQGTELTSHPLYRSPVKTVAVLMRKALLIALFERGRRKKVWSLARGAAESWSRRRQTPAPKRVDADD